MSIVERALDALPPAHWRLWLRAKDVVKQVLRVHCFANRPPSELLVILAEDDVGPPGWIPVLSNSSSSWASRSPGLLVLTLSGAGRRQFLHGLGLDGFQVGPRASRSFAVITVPQGCSPGISWSTVIDRGNLS